jgi:hypothetical protein
VGVETVIGDAAAGLSSGTVQIVVALIGAIGTVVSGYIAVVLVQTHKTARVTKDAAVETREMVNGKMTELVKRLELLEDILRFAAEERDARLGPQTQTDEA